MEITYTQGPMNLNWKQIMATVAQDDRFYMNTEDDEVTEKEAGWEFLRLYRNDDDAQEEQEQEDSEFGEDEEEVASVSTLLLFLSFLFLSELFLATWLIIWPWEFFGKTPLFLSSLALCAI